jgi:hypothetical protein
VKEACSAATAGSCFSMGRGIVLRTTCRIATDISSLLHMGPVLCYGAVSSDYPPVSTAVPTQLQASVCFGGFSKPSAVRCSNRFPVLVVSGLPGRSWCSLIRHRRRPSHLRHARRLRSHERV